MMIVSFVFSCTFVCVCVLSSVELEHFYVERNSSRTQHAQIHFFCVSSWFSSFRVVIILCMFFSFFFDCRHHQQQQHFGAAVFFFFSSSYYHLYCLAIKNVNTFVQLSYMRIRAHFIASSMRFFFFISFIRLKEKTKKKFPLKWF